MSWHIKVKYQRAYIRGNGSIRLIFMVEYR